MDKEKPKYISEDDLTDSDRLVYEVYEKADEPIEWDESDAAILAFAREVAGGEGVADSVAGEALPLAGKPETEGAGEARDGDALAAFGRPEAASHGPRRPAPLAAVALAASLVLGVLLGQGITPYVDLGLAPGYRELVNENERLKDRITTTRSLQVRPSPNEVDPVTGGLGPVAGRITELLDGFECAALSVTLSGKGRLRLSGFVSSADDLRRLGDDLAGYPDLDRVVKDVAVYTRPFCEYLGILGDLSTLGAERPRAPLVQPFDQGGGTSDGEVLVIEASGTSLYEGYLYVDFIRQDGQVIHLLPSDQFSDNLISPGEKVLLRLTAEQSSPDGVYGTGMLAAVVAPRPLFRALQPDVEALGSYRPRLRTALEAVGREAPGAEVLSAYHFVTLPSRASPSSGGDR